MKITAARKDDILKDKAEFEAKEKAYKEASDKAWKDYSEAQKSAMQPSMDAVKTALGDDAEGLEIQMNPRYDNSIELRVGKDRSNNSTRSLVWEWEAYLDRNGEVIKSSNSWSGLEATTLDQIEDLKKTVRQLEILNNLDWKSILDVSLPDYEEYLPDMDRPRTDRDFNQELLEAEIEDIIGQPALVKSIDGVGRYYLREVYFGVIKDSGSQYTVVEVPARWVDQILSGEPFNEGTRIYNTVEELMNITVGSEYRIRKSKFFNSLATPLDIIEY